MYQSVSWFLGYAKYEGEETKRDEWILELAWSYLTWLGPFVLGITVRYIQACLYQYLLGEGMLLRSIVYVLAQWLKLSCIWQTYHPRNTEKHRTLITSNMMGTGSIKVWAQLHQLQWGSFSMTSNRMERRLPIVLLADSFFLNHNHPTNSNYMYSRPGIDGKAFREIPPLRNDLDFGQAFLETGSRFSTPTSPEVSHRPSGIKTMRKMRIQ